MNEQRDKIRLSKFGEHLRNLREKNKLSQDEVVSRCDLTKGNLSNIENGKKDFTFTTLLEIAKGLDIDLRDLVNF
ncbi:MAG: XRE family transcriptional regulator [Pedobacter sp.]|nr:MAG: XRE family transcriptional regulator [Pedobacter sp.]